MGVDARSKMPAVAHYSDHYGRDLQRAWRTLEESLRAGHETGFLICKARALYRAAWQGEVRRGRDG